MKLRLPIAIAIALIAASCHNRAILDIDRHPVMELYGDVLYEDEIEDNIPSGLTGADSANFIENYKKKWAIDRLVYNKALNNVGNTDEINNLVESYRKELIINQYLDEITQQEVESIEDDSLFNFYQQVKHNFPLSEAVAKGLFIKVAANAPEQKKLTNWLADINDDNLENIVRYCTKYAAYQQIVTDNWIPFNKFSDQMSQPIESTDPTLARSTVIQHTKDFNYYLKVTGLCMAGAPQPFELIEPDIRNILTNRAKIKYISEFKENIYVKAIKRGTITLYNANEKNY